MPTSSSVLQNAGGDTIFKDSTNGFVDDVDNTKIVKFQLSGVTTGTTRTVTVPDSSDTMTLNSAAQTLGSKILVDFWRTVVALTDNVTIAIDWFSGAIQTVTIAGNRTLTFANPTEGACYTLYIKQDATGSRTITWPAGIVWRGGQAPTLTTTANKIDKIVLEYVSTEYKADFFLNF